MNSWRLAYEDMRTLWSSRVLRVSVLGLMVLPLLYSFLYLWAFWDPTGKLHHLPLAIVNEDTGINAQGRRLLLGQQLVDELTSDKKLSWKEQPRDQAQRQLSANEVAGILLIPNHFSSAASSAGTDKPEHPLLTLELNEGHNPLSAKIVRSVMEEIKKKLNVKLTTNYLEVVFDQILNGAEGLSEAAAGATRLANGTDDAYSGATALSDGLQQVKVGMSKLTNGLTALQQGANDLESGLAKLDSALAGVTGEADKLIAGWNHALAGLHQAANEAASARAMLTAAIESLHRENSTLTEALNAFVKDRKLLEEAQGAAGNLQSALETQNARTKEVGDSLDKIISSHPELKNEDTSDLRGAADRLQAAASQSTIAGRKLADSLNRASSSQAGPAASDRLADAQARLDQAVRNLSDLAANVASAGQAALKRVEDETGSIKEKLGRITEMINGVSRLAQGSSQLAGGLGTFGTGLNEARTGVDRLADGASRLPQGLAQIRDGQRELAGKLSEAAKIASSDGKSDERIAVMSDPLKVEELNTHPVPNNGTGFAPYFIALSLWVGSLVLFFVIDIHTVTTRPRHPISYIGSKYLALGSVSLSQSILSVFVLHAALGVNTVMPFIHLYGLAAITGLTFAAILMLLIGVLGEDKGRFAAVVVLMLQLTSSSGSYPVELEPGLFRFLHPLLPMTYAVDGFRQVISIGNLSELLTDCAILAAYGLCALALLYVLKRKSIRAEMPNISNI
ncbi:YhgE/Pip domain-containing protein [Cohnella silvisoli]|uniref:YhgE/Pip domain-containing protein n=1 Tax=Cohnella silvisoli TaxID=2873699 RepID=A0ABV1KKU5_9BACL|nr:YhgE/Pip domain-containing protein [Cohnella silvisoli]MCD9020877.1 YhgE/Pip domain-containing protein [Cohnella silvisoli]